MLALSFITSTNDTVPKIQICKYREVKRDFYNMFTFFEWEIQILMINKNQAKSQQGYVDRAMLAPSFIITRTIGAVPRN